MSVKDWSTTASSNATADADEGINFSEGQAPSSLNDSDRAMMAKIKEWFNEVGYHTSAYCRLSYVSTTQIRLDRFKGRCLFINGVNEEIPSVGVTLSNAGLVANTVYYVYAYMNSSTMTLEASTTAYATDSTYGHKIKNGDATRTLVGMIRTDATSQFTNAANKRFVRSYFNDPGITTKGNFTADRSTTSLSYTELNTEIRNEVLLWAGETWSIMANGSMLNTTNGQVCFSTIGIDGTPQDAGVITTTSASFYDAYSITLPRNDLAEGYHYATLMGSVAAGTGTWRGFTTNDRCTLYTTARL